MPKKVESSLIIVAFLISMGIKTDALMVDLSLEEITEEAEVIVQGKANKIWSDWNEDRSLIYTYVILGVTDLLKGGGQLLEQVTLRFRGGEVEGIGMAESDMPSFTVGEEVILFLHKKKERHFKLVGSFQGKFKVEVDKLTQKKIITQAGYSVVKKVGGRLVLDSRTPGRIFLTNFKKIIREIIREQFQKQLKNK